MFCILSSVSAILMSNFCTNILETVQIFSFAIFARQLSFIFTWSLHVLDSGSSYDILDLANVFANFIPQSETSDLKVFISVIPTTHWLWLFPLLFQWYRSHANFIYPYLAPCSSLFLQIISRNQTLWLLAVLPVVCDASRKIFESHDLVGVLSIIVNNYRFMKHSCVSKSMG